MEDSPIKVVNTCDEQGAGFAADAYARVNGFGAACITYCVGGLKIANAGLFAAGPGLFWRRRRLPEDLQKS